MDWLTKNWGAKLVSLVLAIGLWYYALGEEGIEVTRTIPVDIRLQDSKMSIVGEPRVFVLVTLQAPRSLLANLASEELKAEHKVAKVENPGEYSFRLEPGEIRLPSEQIRVVRIQPEVIQIKIDEVIVQKFEVEPDFLGDPAFGYEVDRDGLQLDPRAVMIEGPKSQLEKVGKIKTQPIDLVGRTRSFRKTVRLAVEPGLKAITESLVDAYVPLREATGEKTFDNIPVKVLSQNDWANRIKVEPGLLTLAIKGPPKDLEKIQAKDIVAYVEVSNPTEGVYEQPLLTVLPHGVILKGNAPLLRVTVQRKNLSS